MGKEAASEGSANTKLKKQPIGRNEYLEFQIVQYTEIPVRQEWGMTDPPPRLAGKKQIRDNAHPVS